MRKSFHSLISKKSSFLILALLSVCVGFAQVPIAYYDFEDNSSRNTTAETSVQEIITSVGSPSITVNSLTAAHGAGNGTTYGGSNTGYALGYYGFTTGAGTSTSPNVTFGPFDCTSFSTLSVQLDFKGLGIKKPYFIELYYSTDPGGNGTYTKFSSQTTVWTSYQTKSYNLPAAANGSSTVYLRILGSYALASPTSSDGVLLIDNLTLLASSFGATTSLISSQSHGTGLSSGGSYSPVYGALTINGTGITATCNSDINLSGKLTLTNGNFDIQNNTLTFKNCLDHPISRSSGKLVVGASANLVFSNYLYIPSTTLPDNLFSTSPASFSSITCDRGAGSGLTLGSNAINLSGNLTINSGTVTISSGTSALTVQGNLNVNNATFIVSPYSYTAYVNGNLNMTSGIINLGGSNISVAGNITGTGSQAATTAGGKIIATGSGATMSSGITYFNVDINTATSVSLTGSTTFAGQLKLVSGTLNVGAGNTLSLTATNISSPIAKTSGFISMASTSNLILGSGSSSYDFAIPNSCFVAPTTFNNLTFNIGSKFTDWGLNPVTITGTLAINSNVKLSNGSGNITLQGSTSGTAGFILGNSGKLIVTSPSAVLTPAISYANVDINSPSGFSLSGNTTIGGTLTLTSGQLSVGSNSLIFHTNNTPISRVAGTIDLATSSNLVFGTVGNLGGGAFTIPNNVFTSSTPEFANFTINRTNSITLNNQPFALKGVLTITSGTLVLPNSYIFTLRSTSITNTAMVGVVGASGAIQYGTGAAFRVERYIPQSAANSGFGVRAYRDISSSVNSGAGKIFDNWQESGGTGLVGSVYYGTQITGVAGASPGGVDATTGFDITLAGSKSLNTNDIDLSSGNSVWNTVNSTKGTNDTLSAFKGYRIFIRGDRRVNLYATPSPANSMNAPATLRSTGKLVTGNVVFTTSGVTANGATNTGIRLNSGSATGYTLIGNPYAAPIDWNLIFADASTSNISSTYTVWDANVGTTGGYATYNQSTGITVPSGSAANRYIQPGQAFYIQNTTTAPAITFKESHKAVSTSNLTATFRETKSEVSKIHIDVKKVIAGTENLLLDGTAIAYDSKFSNKISQEDALKMENSKENISIISNDKQLSIEGRNFPSIFDSVKLNLTQFSEGEKYQLVVNTTDFVNKGLQPYLVDKFTNTTTLLNLLSVSTYSFIVTANENSYNNRFVIVYRTNISDNKDILVKIAEKQNINVSPNPVVDKKINLAVSNLPIDTYQVNIYNSNGLLVFKTKLDYLGGTLNQTIQLPRNISAGNYTISLLKERIKISKSIVIE